MPRRSVRNVSRAARRRLRLQRKLRVRLPAKGVALDETPASGVRLKTDIVVIGAGQAGLSSAYHLQRRGLSPNRGFVVLDQSPNAGGAWQFRWPSLTLSTVNR